MSDYCVVVASGAHARFFKLESREIPELECGPKLIECSELYNPEKEMAGRDIYADPKSGRGRAPHGGPSHGYNDHRSQHEDECDRRFACRVLERAKRFAQANKARHVVLVAPARMLGWLRQELDIIRKHGIQVYEFAKDLTKSNPKQIHEYLAQEQLLPRRKNAGM